MRPERREHERVGKRFDGTWRGASGGGSCAVCDLSLSGCFVQTLATQSTGAETTVTINFGAHALSLAGRVVYAERGMGFAVRFHDMSNDEVDQLRKLIDSLINAPALASGG